MNIFLLKKYAVLIFVGLSLYSYAYPVFSSEKEPLSTSKLDWIIKNIQGKEKSLKTFTARMVQTKKTHLLREPLHSEGFIYFDYTGKMLLKITVPSPLIVLLKNNMLVLYYPDLSKVKETYIGNNILREYFGIGQSVEELRKRYLIRLVGETPTDGYHLELIPKHKTIAKHIDSIEVTVGRENWLPQRICFKEKAGDWSDIRLEFISINEPLPAGVFTFNFPEKDDERF
ncbi:MAG: outer membrane lipoprotein carrier protein LolA [Desulfobacterales bacterium]|nr:outer membrane lipoprotein carrier protein LolA [Desulfobacterales bacterium]